jgi:hypothetical protein
MVRPALGPRPNDDLEIAIAHLPDPGDFVPEDEPIPFPFHNLTEENWIIYATKNYINPNCASYNEFQADMKIFKYLRKLFTHYEKTGNLKERLILNHLIVLNNVLLPQALTRILFLKIKNLTALKPFLIGLSLCPRIVQNINGLNISTDFIPLDPVVVSALRALGLR